MRRRARTSSSSLRRGPSFPYSSPIDNHRQGIDEGFQAGDELFRVVGPMPGFSTGSGVRLWFWGGGFGDAGEEGGVFGGALLAFGGGWGTGGLGLGLGG